MIQKTLSDKRIITGTLFVLLTVLFSFILLLFEHASAEYVNYIIPDLIICEAIVILCYANNIDNKIYCVFLVIHHIGIITHCILGTNMLKIFVFDAFGLAFAIVVLFLMEYLRSKRYERTIIHLLVFTTSDILIFLILLVFGERIGGTKAWISFFGMSIQLTEFMKLILLAFSACLFSSKLKRSAKHLCLSIFTCMNVVFLAVLNEFGTAIVILFVYLCATLLYCSTRAFLISIVFVSAIILLTACIDYLICHYIESTSQPISFIQQLYESIIVKINTRVQLWISPSSLDYDSTYQTMRAREALTQGGLLGSNSKIPVYVPIQSSDFIFTSIVENLGLATGIGIICLFIYVTVHLLRKSISTNEKFDSVCISIPILFIVVSSMIMILGSTGAFVLTGVPIAFLSEGGTQTIVNFALAGVSLSFCSKERLSKAVIKHLSDRHKLRNVQQRTKKKRRI